MTRREKAYRRRREAERRRRRRQKKSTGVGILVRILALFAVCAMPFFLLKTAAASEDKAKILIEAKEISIFRGEEAPAIEVDVKVEGHAEKELDKDTGYTVADLAADLKKEGAYTVTCEADAKTEGSYPIQIVLNEDYQKAFAEQWLGLATLEIHNATFEVKNKVGTWDGDKFKKYDGSYVENDFVNSKGDVYYFGEDGKKVTGWQTIHGSKYYFDENGIRQSGWKEDGDGNKYYLAKNGAASTGWREVKEKQYYFDTDGKMVTGELKIGFTMYEFAKDGTLESQKMTGIDPDKPMVALTFDDGPGARTGELLEQLEKYNAHATFFMLGQKVSSHKDDVKKMLEIGCELGNHSYSHPNLTKKSASGVKKQIGNTNVKLKKAAGQGATVMRPPYGAINDTVKNNVGLPMILWNIDTLDWKTRDAKKTIKMVMKNVDDGDIILLHDIHSESIDAALKLIPKLESAGYQLVTVSELAAAKGIKLEAGGKYTDF